MVGVVVMGNGYRDQEQGPGTGALVQGRTRKNQERPPGASVSKKSKKRTLFTVLSKKRTLLTGSLFLTLTDPAA